MIIDMHTLLYIHTYTQNLAWQLFMYKYNFMKENLLNKYIGRKKCKVKFSIIYL